MDQNGLSTNQHEQDVNSKTVLGNHKLCAQFLRDYINVPGFQDITDQDIEDVTERFTSYFGVEYNADTVKKVRIHQDGEEMDVYVISLIDHKSQVDYNVSIQLLKYMVCIWAEYEKKMSDETQRDGITDNKGFKYPPIIPIVYYEGTAPWTADRHLKDRVMLNDIFEKFIPDYEYIVVRNHDYTNEELLAKKDEMSLIMLINKIQRKEDLTEYLKIPAEEINKIVKESPQELINIIAAVIRALCERVNATQVEKEECVRRVVNRQMGYLFENMEAWDIQAERKKTQEQAQKTEAERQRAEAEKQKAEVERQKAEVERQRAETERQRAEAEKQRAEVERKRAEAEKERAESAEQQAGYFKKELEEAMIERNVFRLACQGKSHEEISKTLNINVVRVREFLRE